MKVRIRGPRLAITKRNGKRCPCCDHLNWKCKLMDKQSFKEALQEVHLREEDWI